MTGDLPAGRRGGDGVGGEGHGWVAVEIEELRLAKVLVPAGVAGVDGAEVERAGDRGGLAAAVDIHNTFGNQYGPDDNAAEVADPEGRDAVCGINHPTAGGQSCGRGGNHGQLRV